MRFWLTIAALLSGCQTDLDPESPWGDIDPFADQLVSFTPGDFAGYGQDELPDIVLGHPEGNGPQAGGLDVLSLGRGGSIVLKFSDILLHDGPGPDLLVFENPFPAWRELARVAVSEEGETWHEWPCDPQNTVDLFPGCAGYEPVLANTQNGIDPTNPAEAGGDAFDLADLGLDSAQYVRITDTGTNPYEGTTGGFDLDAISVVHWDIAP